MYCTCIRVWPNYTSFGRLSSFHLVIRIYESNRRSRNLFPPLYHLFVTLIAYTTDIQIKENSFMILITQSVLMRLRELVKKNIGTYCIRDSLQVTHFRTVTLKT